MNKTKLSEHIVSSSLISLIWSFESLEKENAEYKGTEGMENFFESLREYTVETVGKNGEKIEKK